MIVLGVLTIISSNIIVSFLMRIAKNEDKRLKIVKLEATIYFTIIVAFALFVK